EPARAGVCYLGAARGAAARYAYPEAERLYRACLRSTPGPSADRVGAQNELGELVLEVQGKLDEAREGLHQALAEARSISDRAGEAASLRRLGFISWKAGRMEEAGDHYQQALAILSGLHDPHLLGLTLRNLATLYHFQGKMGEAQALYEQALSLSRE